MRNPHIKSFENGWQWFERTHMDHHLFWIYKYWDDYEPHCSPHSGLKEKIIKAREKFGHLCSTIRFENI